MIPVVLCFCFMFYLSRSRFFVLPLPPLCFYPLESYFVNEALYIVAASYCHIYILNIISIQTEYKQRKKKKKKRNTLTHYSLSQCGWKQLRKRNEFLRSQNNYNMWNEAQRIVISFISPTRVMDASSACQSSYCSWHMNKMCFKHFTFIVGL